MSRFVVFFVGLVAFILSGCGTPPMCGPQANNAGCSPGYVCEPNSGLCMPQGGGQMVTPNPNPQPDMGGGTGNPNPPTGGNPPWDNGHSCNGDHECKSAFCDYTAPRVCKDRPPMSGNKVRVLDSNVIRVSSPNADIEPHIYANTPDREGADFFPASQSVRTFSVTLPKDVFCPPGPKAYGFNVGVRVGYSINMSMPYYGCMGPSLEDALRTRQVTVEFNGTLMNDICVLTTYSWGQCPSGKTHLYCQKGTHLDCG